MIRPSALAFATIVLALARPAWAETPDATVATQLFNAGRDAMKSGDYRAACPKLAESARLDAKVGTLARLAECEEKLGNLASARGHWQQAVNLARADHDNRLAHVEEELARVDKVVPKLLFAVDGEAPADLVIRVDELHVGLGSLGVPLPVDPGSHTVSAAAAGKKPWLTSLVTAADGAVTTVRVPALETVPVAPTPVPPVPPAPGPAPDHPPAAASGASPLRSAGLVVGGVGVVGLGVGAAFAVVAKQKLDQSNSGPGACVGNECPRLGFDARTDARNAGNFATVFLVAGGSVAAGGALMWLLAPRGTPEPGPSSASLVVVPSAGPGGAGLFLRGGW
jgi:hypothetical protein